MSALARYRAGKKARKTTSVTKFRKGYDRTGGTYGRFKGTAGELKFKDTLISATAIDTTVEMFDESDNLVRLVQNTSASGRIGRKVTLKSVQFKGAVSSAPSAATNFNGQVDIYLIQDTQANGALPDSVSQIFIGNNSNALMPNLDNKQRFKILVHKQITMPQPGGVSAAYNNATKAFNFYKKVNIPIFYNSTDGLIDERRSNNLFFVWGAVGGDDLCSMYGTWRIRYEDS